MLFFLFHGPPQSRDRTVRFPPETFAPPIPPQEIWRFMHATVATIRSKMPKSHFGTVERAPHRSAATLRSSSTHRTSAPRCFLKEPLHDRSHPETEVVMIFKTKKNGHQPHQLPSYDQYNAEYLACDCLRWVLIRRGLISFC